MGATPLTGRPPLLRGRASLTGRPLLTVLRGRAPLARRVVSCEGRAVLLLTSREGRGGMAAGVPSESGTLGFRPSAEPFCSPICDQAVTKSAMAVASKKRRWTYEDAGVSSSQLVGVVTSTGHLGGESLRGRRGSRSRRHGLSLLERHGRDVARRDDRCCLSEAKEQGQSKRGQRSELSGAGLTTVVSVDGGLHEGLHPVPDQVLLLQTEKVRRLLLVDDAEAVRARVGILVRDDLVALHVDVALELGILLMRRQMSCSQRKTEAERSERQDVRSRT